MSGWVALNVEPDETVEEEVDNTKEIQVEEALKLYQNALKLHSQGPRFYSQAAEAYDALLKSDIFLSPESISDNLRNALQDPEVDAVDQSALETFAEVDINDSTSSSLFKTIYLSYKNYGQYLLDSLQDFLRNTPQAARLGADISEKVTANSSSALSSFADALERDDTDMDLWRRSARLSSALQSYRLARYCLESVLVDDDNRLEVRTQQLGLDETCAEESLRSTLLAFHDRLWVSQVPVKKPKKALLKFFKRQIDPYPYLPTLPPHLENADSAKVLSAIQPGRYTLELDASSWHSLGEEILRAVFDRDSDPSVLGPGAAISINLPSEATSPPTKESPLHETSPTNPSKRDEPEKQPDVATLEDDTDDKMNVDVPTKTTEDEPSNGRDGREVEGQPNEPPKQPGTPSAENGKQQESVDAGESNSRSSIGARKRSSTSVVNDEPPEGGRTKRRTRARESNAETLAHDEVAFDQNKYYQDKLQVFVEADDMMFATVGSLLSRVGLEGFGSIDQLRKQIFEPVDAKELTQTAQVNPEETETLLYQDLRNTVGNWNERAAQLAREKDPLSTLQDVQGTNKFGLSVFLELFKKSNQKPPVDKLLEDGDSLRGFVSIVNSDWIGLDELSFRWLQSLLMPEHGEGSAQMLADGQPVAEATYTSTMWPDELKSDIVQLLTNVDEYVYGRMDELVTTLERRILASAYGSPFEYGLKHAAELEMIQTIFELHLDIYAQMNSPNSEVGKESRILQRDRLERWSTLARGSLSHFLDYSPPGPYQRCIALRHIWASTFLISMSADVQHDHILLCLQDVKLALNSLGDPVIHLINNAIMPEISVSAVDREVSKMKSIGFFTRIFDPSSQDPVDIIESIEPILEPLSVEYVDKDIDHCTEFQEMATFVERGDCTLRLCLWRKLLDAYKAIDYTPKVVSCCLRSIETIVEELWSIPRIGDKTTEERQAALLRWLKPLDAFLAKTVALVFHEPEKAYESVDNEHVKSSLFAVSRLLRLLHRLTLYEDSVRVGQTPAPELRSSLSKSLETLKEKLRELQVHCWFLHYTLLKEAISQNKELFGDSSEACIQYLCHVHDALGCRSMCKYSNKRFLKLMKSELFALGAGKEYGSEICQVLFDLYGFKFSSFDDVSSHGCPTEKLDRATAIMMIHLVMERAKGLNIKDLPKSDLKATIDRMQTVIGLTKASIPQLVFNRRLLNSYLKSPIDPSFLFCVVQGIGELSMVRIQTESANIASTGWYFLLGCAALTKFRSQKRLNPVPTPDLDDAITYFRQDLEHGTGGWESWYRLGQAYDSKLEEDLTWSAEKINGSQTELVNWQRYTIRCYAMAVATAIRTMDPTAENEELLSDLYTDFAIRMYLSSREPLSMKAFGLGDLVRYFSKEESQEMYKTRPFEEMKPYTVWKFAAHLLRRALVTKPDRWMLVIHTSLTW